MNDKPKPVPDRDPLEILNEILERVIAIQEGLGLLHAERERRPSHGERP
jgi:hypothetical protein